MADRRNLWNRLHDEAQVSDPLLALAAIKRINNIAGRWERAAVRAAFDAGRDQGERKSDTMRRIADASGDTGWKFKANQLDARAKPLPAEFLDEMQQVLMRAGFAEVDSWSLARSFGRIASGSRRVPLDP